MNDWLVGYHFRFPPSTITYNSCFFVFFFWLLFGAALYPTGIFHRRSWGVELEGAPTIVVSTLHTFTSSEFLSIIIPKGLFPSNGAKVIIFSTFSVISGSCNRVSVTPEVLSSISHHPSLPMSLQSVTNCSV